MSDRDTKWRLDGIDRRLDTIDRRLDRFDQQLDRRLNDLVNVLRELRRDVSALERTIVREHGDRIVHLEQRLMADKEEA
jgi:hypothetical protein